MFHIYIENDGGDAYLRQSTYFSQRGGQKPAAWEASSTADYWGRRLAEGQDFFVKSCQRPNACCVCEAQRKEAK